EIEDRAGLHDVPEIDDPAHVRGGSGKTRHQEVVIVGVIVDDGRPQMRQRRLDLRLEPLQERFDQGTEAEADIVRIACSRHDGKLGVTQEEIELAIGSSILIRGHTDGRAHTDLGDYIIEAKNFGPSHLSKWRQGNEAFFEAFPYYRDQATIYMEALGLPMIYAVRDREQADRADDMSAIETRVIDEPPGNIAEVKAKILRVETAGKKGELPDDCGPKGEQFPCPVYYLHTGSGEELDEVEGDFATEVDALARAYRDGIDLEKSGKEMKSAAKAKLLEVLEREGVDDKFTTGLFTVTPYEHRSRWLDQNLMREAGLDPDEFKSEKVSANVRVKEVGV
ncbi:MAG: hypothetical protein R3324_18485, partial [Halobacteriales archaeon]|nr:hypothetical protein [Halobacteriales archaeon]